MKALVTGATGLVGNAIARLLARHGHEARALVRDPARARPLLPEKVELVAGDITDPASLRDAPRGVDVVFHAAGMPEQWQADEAVFDRVNRQGTANVLRAARDAGVARVVHTSTLDVFEAPPGGTLVETRLDESPKPTAYERSKVAAEREAAPFLAEGLEVVFVNPAAVYGPGPVNVALNSFFIKLLKRQVPALPPGGMSVVYVDGAARAHIAAAEKGRTGERYLVSDCFVTNRRLAEEICAAVGRRGVPKTAPAWAMKALAAASEPFARLLGFTPLIAKGQLSFLLWSVDTDTTKARSELGFAPTPLADGVRATVSSLRAKGLV